MKTEHNSINGWGDKAQNNEERNIERIKTDNSLKWLVEEGIASNHSIESCGE